MTDCDITLRGERLLLDPAGAAFWPAASLLAVADLHFEKGSAAARRGQLVPPWDSALTLARLALLLEKWRPQVVVAVGDSFEDDGGPGRLCQSDRMLLAAMASQARFVWVSGNHDPSPPLDMPGLAVPVWCEGALLFRHQAAASAAPGEVSGHFHPKARVATRAGEVVRPCFVTDSVRLVLPAFGAYTGGLDVRAPALAAVFPAGGSVHLLGQAKIFSFALPVPTPVATTADHLA